MPVRLHPVTAASIAHAPPPCVGCVFWQSRGHRVAAKGKWAEKIEEDRGAWGTLYFGDADSLLGFIQYGPAGHFPRAWELPAGPPSDDAVLITCVYLVDPNTLWVLQSLATRERRRWRRSLTATPRARAPTSASSSTARSSRLTSSPTSASIRSAGMERSPWLGSSSVGSSRSWRARARSSGAR